MRLHLSQEDTCQLVVSARAIVTDIHDSAAEQPLGRPPSQGRGAKREVAATFTYQLPGLPERERRVWAKYQARMNADGGHRVGLVDMVGDGRAQVLA